MANWKVHSGDWKIVDDYENQNGSSLTHYGVKGMKWGVRKEPEKVKTSNSAKGASKAYGPGSGVGRTSNSAKGASKAYSPGSKIGNQRSGNSSGKSGVAKRVSSSWSTNTTIRKGSKNVGDHITGPQNPYEEGHMNLPSSSQLEAERNWLERILNIQEKEYERLSDEEIKARSDKYKEQMRKSQERADKIEAVKKFASDGAKKVGEVLKKIGSTVMSSAKNLINSGKNLIANLFGKKNTNNSTKRTGSGSSGSSGLTKKLTSGKRTGSGSSSGGILKKPSYGSRR